MVTQKGQSWKKISQQYWKFMQKSANGLRSRKELLGLCIYIWEYSQKVAAHLSPKICHNFTYWLKEGSSWSIVVTVKVRVVAACSTLQALAYIEGNDWTGGSIWNYATRTLTSWKGCWTGSCYPTQLWGSAHPCKLESNQNMGELQQPRNKNDSPFRQTMINN